MQAKHIAAVAGAEHGMLPSAADIQPIRAAAKSISAWEHLKSGSFFAQGIDAPSCHSIPQTTVVKASEIGSSRHGMMLISATKAHRPCLTCFRLFHGFKSCTSSLYIA